MNSWSTRPTSIDGIEVRNGVRNTNVDTDETKILKLADIKPKKIYQWLHILSVYSENVSWQIEM